MTLLLVAIALLALEIIISMLKSDPDSVRIPDANERTRDEPKTPEPGYAKNARTAPVRTVYGLAGQERIRSYLCPNMISWAS